MWLPSISSSLLAISALTLASIRPTSAMVVDLNIHTDATFGMEKSFTALASCGFPSGNCFDNDCEGEKGKNADTCSNGAYKGCPCGYGCGKNTGSCFSNGCNGAPDPDAGGRPRCRGKYFGCDCII